jgi:hypothetical protein
MFLSWDGVSFRLVAYKSHSILLFVSSWLFFSWSENCTLWNFKILNLHKAYCWTLSKLKLHNLLALDPFKATLRPECIPKSPNWCLLLRFCNKHLLCTCTCYALVYDAGYMSYLSYLLFNSVMLVAK